MSGRSTVLLAALALLVGGCAGGGSGAVDRPAPTAAPSTTGGLDPAVYAPPDPLPPGPPGEVLAREPVNAPAGARAWRVLYRSQSTGGRLLAVSGLVVVPSGSAPEGGWPVLSWAHGTTGSADRCAPSRAGVSVIPGLTDLLAAGYVVAATDYEGLGTPGPHPYLVGASEGRSVLDAARAARQLEPSAAGPVLAWGHSQGGQAAIWAGELAPSYAPDLPLVGVAAFAPAVRQATFLDLADGRGPAPAAAGFTVAAAAGLAAAHPELQLSDVLSDAALARLDLLESGCIGEVSATFALVAGGVLRPDAGRRADWRAALDANQAGEQGSPVPVLVLLGERDVLVPPSAVEQYVGRACRAGSPVQLERYPEADHGSILTQAWDDTTRWSAGRRTGDTVVRPAPSC